MAFFDTQPEHIKNLVLRQTPECTAKQMADQLHELGVETNAPAVAKYRNKNGVSFGWHRIITPAATYDARTLQYINALAQFNGKVFSNRMLGLKTGAWIRCARRLSDAGLTERYDDRTPAKYVRLVSDDVIAEWYDREVAGGK